MWYEGSGTSDRRFLMADERGSIVSVTDSAGATIAINSYDEFGNPAAGNVGRFGYTGQAWLAEVGLWYYKARMYSPTLGRFMQTDPIGYADGMNWYDYVDGDPVNFSDPSGLQCTGSRIAKNCAGGHGVARSLSVSVPLALGSGGSGGLGESFEVFIPGAGNNSGPGGSIVVNGGRFVRSNVSGASGAGASGSWEVNNGDYFLELDQAVIIYKAYGYEPPETPYPVITPKGKALLDSKPVGSALKNDKYHRVPRYITVFAAYYGKSYSIKGGDGITRQLTQILGSWGGVSGRFEFIVDPSGNMTHRFFVAGGHLKWKAYCPMRSHKAFDYRAANNIVKLNEIDIRFGIESGFLENVKNYPDIKTFDISISKKKWLLISISLSILENENNLEELFREVDYILADFEYPDSANNLLSFFPADDPDSSPGYHLTRIKKFCSDLKDEIDKQNPE